MNKRDLFQMYLTEDVTKAEENYKRWREGYNQAMTSAKASQMLLAYYRRETVVAYEIWQYKVQCYNKKFRGSNRINDIEKYDSLAED